MSNLVQFKSAGLPSVASLAAHLRMIQKDVGPTGGAAILKMAKDGLWIFGADQTEVEDGSRWAVNPFSFVHGWIAWGDGEVLGEKMTAITQPLPETEDAPPGAKRGWEKQVGMSLACIGGEDKGLEVRYSTTSVGGKRAVQDIAVAIAEQVEKDQANPVPVVLLKKDHYAHKSYGKIYTPIFDVVEWVSMGGEAPAAEVAPEAPPARRRRVAAA